MRALRRMAAPLVLAAAIGGAAAAPAMAGEIAVQNLDGLPYDDHMAFNRFGNNKNYAVHNVATLRILNQDSSPLTVTSLQFTGQFGLAQSVALPRTIPANSFLDIQVRYNATTAGSPDANRHAGTLRIGSNDANEPTTTVTLGGVWSTQPQGNNEPPLDDVVAAFGYRTQIINSGQTMARQGRVLPVGEEVLSPYWRRADETKPVTIRQLSASHGNIAASVSWYEINTTTLNTIFAHAIEDQQSILPRLSGNLAAPAAGSFTPPAGQRFGFKVLAAWSDDLRNVYADNCTPPYTVQSDGRTCGHYMRFWPLRDRNNVIRPNAYLMSMDIAVSNYDYQDNIYLVENIQPAGSAPDTIAPNLTTVAPANGAVDVPVASNVVPRFDDVLKIERVTAANVQLRPTAGGAAVPATLTRGGGNTRITIDPVSDLQPGTQYTLTITPGLTDNSGNAVTGAPITSTFTTAGSAPPPPPPVSAYQFVGNQVAMEAENADEGIARSGKSWDAATPPAGAVGGAMTVRSDSGTVFEAASAATTAPELRFRVNFPAAGTYRLALRGYAPNTSGNSVHVGIDGTLPSTSDAMTLGTFGSHLWFAGSAGGPTPGTITVPTAGVHTVNVWAREDGFTLDRLVLATPGTATPTGNGPAESPRL